MSLTDALLLDPYRDRGEIFLAVRTDGQRGCGTRSDPYDAGTAERFDALMRALPEGSAVHLGPGLFHTNGYSDEWLDVQPERGWQIKAGMRICGAGMGATTLMWDLLIDGAAEYYAIAHRLSEGDPEMPVPVDFAEVSDLTIDCGFYYTNALFSCGAVRLMGDHVRIRRVRAINWGTVSASRPCRVFSLVTAYEAEAGTWASCNVGAEDCIGDGPSLYMLLEADPASFFITVFHVGCSGPGSTGREIIGKVPFIRNCYVDCSLLNESGIPGVDALSRDIRGISMSHCLGGVVEGN